MLSPANVPTSVTAAAIRCVSAPICKRLCIIGRIQGINRRELSVKLIAIVRALPSLIHRQPVPMTFRLGACCILIYYLLLNDLRLLQSDLARLGCMTLPG